MQPFHWSTPVETRPVRRIRSVSPISRAKAVAGTTGTHLHRKESLRFLCRISHMILRPNRRVFVRSAYTTFSACTDLCVIFLLFER
jgi:hypothetical protein